MRFDRKKFFDGIKARIDSTLEQSQVDGLNFLLEHFETDPHWTDIRHIAYAFGTTAHETAFSFQPVEEGYYLEEKHGKSFLLKFQKGLRYYPFFGRGYVQLTWESAKIKNYSKATRELRKQMPSLVAQFEAESGKVFDLVKNPDQAMHPLIAFAVLTLGMAQGWFTGKKLADYIKGAKCDYINARRIINGTDKAGPIAQLARRFEEILRASLIDSADVTADFKAAAVFGEAGSAFIPNEPAPSEPPAGSSEPGTSEPPPPENPVKVEPEVHIEKIEANTEPPTEVPGIPASYIGAGTFITTAVSWLAGATPYIIAGIAAVGIAFFGFRFWFANKEKQRQADAAEAEKIRAHEMQLAIVKTASEKDLTTVRIV